MRSSRTAITICYVQREEVVSGVWENVEYRKVVRAEQEQLYQRRVDQANAEGLVLTARFKIRLSTVVDKELKYVEWRGKRYKTSNALESVDSHFSVIEIGEML